MPRFLLYDLNRFQVIQYKIARYIQVHQRLPESDRILERLRIRAECLRYNKMLLDFYTTVAVYDPMDFLAVYESSMMYIGLCDALKIYVC